MTKGSGDHYTAHTDVNDYQVTVASGAKVNVTSSGQVRMKATDVAGETTVTLENTLCVPDLQTNLLSVSTVDRRGGAVIFADGQCHLLQDASAVAKSGILNKAALRGRLTSRGHYVVGCAEAKPGASVASAPVQGVAQLMHRRFMHLGYKNLERLAGMVDGMSADDVKAVRVAGAVCAPCAVSKMAHAPIKSTKRNTEVMELLHSDVCGPFPETFGDAKYFVTLVDDKSALKVAVPIKHKSDVGQVLMSKIRLLERLSGRKAKRLRTDGAKEYATPELTAFYELAGIQHEPTDPYTPQSNGKAERVNRTLKERVRAAMSEASAEDELWGEALAAAVYVLNRSPHEGTSVTPWEAFTGKRPDVSGLRVWGSRAWALKTPKEQRRMEPKALVGRFVGYTRSGKGYRVLLDGSDQVVERRDVVMEETTPTSTCVSWVRDNNGVVTMETNQRPDASSDVQAGDAEDEDANSMSSEDDDDVPSRSDSDDGDDSGDGSPATTDVPSATKDMTPGRRYPLRMRKKTGQWWTSNPDKDNDNAEAMTAAALPIDDSLGEPKSVKEAAMRPDWPEWQRAIDEEMEAMERKHVWQMVKPPPGCKPIKTKMLLQYKRDAEGRATRHKARLVMKGFRQVYGRDYDETWAPVPNAASTRVLLAMAAAKDWEVHHVDIRTAFLNADMDKELYIELPDGITEKFPGKVGLVLKAMYGSKQASNLWSKLLDKKMSGEGAHRSDADPCVYVWETPEHGKVFLLVHVDDILLICATLEGVKAAKAMVARHFQMRDLGEVTDFLGMRVSRDRAGKALSLANPGHINSLLKSFNMEQCRPNVNPMAAGCLLKRTGDKPLPEENRYAELIGSLMYLATQTRPDIAFAVGVLARHVAAPEEQHMAAAKGILRYLAGTANMGIRFQGCQDAAGYSDADYAGDADTRKSTSGMLFTLHGGPVIWRSKLQRTVASSTAEAEYVAAAAAAKESLWLRRLLRTAGEASGPLVIAEDNQACIHMATNPDVSARSKHVDVAYPPYP